MSKIEFSNSVVNFSGNLMPFAINLTKDKEDAQDLIQETVFKALSNHSKFKPGTNLKAWLYTIMKNIFINNYRRKIKKNTILDTTENQYLLNNASSLHITKNEAENKFIMDHIQNAIGKLNDEFRVPFLMHYQGYKYQEIADNLNLPLGTVKSRIFFARKDLKNKLNVFGSDR